jgi:putative hydrolase of HD superfamily
LAESIVGDLTPEDYPKSKKIRLENNAMRKILSTFDDAISRQYWSLWMQYQKKSSKEAKLLHQIDKLEMALQADVYEKSGHKKEHLKPFFDSAKKQIKDSDLKKILQKLS